MTTKMKPRRKAVAKQAYLFDEAVPTNDEGALIFDYFAGGGGASHGIEQALGRSPDVAINHCANAIAMHAVNHPTTTHIKSSVWNINARRQLPTGHVRLFWASPDCKHFSRAKGGKPVSKKIRGLAWIVLRIMGQRRPDVTVVENVAEFQDWGPVRDGQPIKAKAGQTFRKWVRQMEALGAVVEKRVLNAADYGAPTHRRRLFIIARLDGKPIVWPEPTHGPGREHPYKTAAECIDWSIPCPSIFGRKRPLAEATMRRIAEGLKRFVFESAKPFIIPVRSHGGGGNGPRSADLPLRTITTTKRGEFAAIVPTLVQTGYGEREGQTPRALDIQAPLGTVVASGKHALVTAFLAKHYGGVVGHMPDRPIGTITAVDHHSVVTAHLTKFHGDVGGRTRAGQPVDEPIHTIDTAPRYGLVAAFCIKYYGQGTGQALSEPLHTVVSKARFGLVTVTLNGEEYALVDVGLRMLSPKELARCQGFDEDYHLVGTQAEQVARVGNSVSPPIAKAIVAANVLDTRTERRVPAAAE